MTAATQASSAIGTSPPRPASHPGHEGGLSAIPGVVFSGGFDGVLRALASDSGRVIWDYDTVKDYQTVNGVAPLKRRLYQRLGPNDYWRHAICRLRIHWRKEPNAGNVLLAFSTK